VNPPACRLDQKASRIAGDNQGQESVMASVRKSAWMSRADRRTLGLTGELADLIRTLQTLVADPYRPELHYMRGPGPKWHAKYDPAPAAVDDRAVPGLARANG
jgi:hypothetical protein